MFSQDIGSVRSSISAGAARNTPFLFAVDFELSEGMYIEFPEKQSRILYSVSGASNKPDLQTEKNDGHITPSPISPSEYKGKFDIVRQALLRGDTYLTNLTIRTPVQCRLSLEEIFQRATAPYQLLVPGRFVCFSPERFVKISRDGTVATNPMKGTIDASVPDAARLIMEDPKEVEEHNTIVDLLRNDLSMRAKSVTVERFRYIDRIQTRNCELLQVSSLITGSLPSNWRENLGNILFAMLPAGSCSGAPKRSTVQVIQKAEGEPRGYYTGVFGYFDGEELDCAVMIRFIEKRNDSLFFRSGGGITARSDWRSEYNEALQKIYLPFA